MQDKIFYTICVGFIGGVLLHSFIFVNTFVMWLLVLLGVAIFLFAYFSDFRWGVILSVCLLAFVFGWWRFHISGIDSMPSLESKVGSRVSLVGQIVDEPDIRENNQKLIIEVAVGGEQTKILVTTGFGADYKYGDEVHLSGKLAKPENFTTDTGKEFDYVNYLKKDGIYYVMNYVIL